MDSLSLIALLLIGLLVTGLILGILGFIKANQIERELSLLKIKITNYDQPLATKPTPATSKISKPSETIIPPAESAPAAKTKKPPSQTTTPDKIGFAAKVEQSLRGNWLVWVAGIVLAFGGVFLVQVAAESGLLGPGVRVALAGLAGAAMLGFAHKLRLQPLKNTSIASSAAPQVLAGAGLITLYGAAYASFALFELINPLIAFALLALIAALAVYQAAKFGPIIAVFGLIGAFVAPALIGSDDPSAITLFGYVLVVSVGGLLLARLRPWRWNAILALAGGLGWPLLWLLGGNGDNSPWVLQLYLPVLASVTMGLAWQQAGTAFNWTKKNRSPLSLYSALITLLGVGLLVLFLIIETSYQPPSLITLLVLGILALAGSFRREGFSLGAGAIAIISCIVLALWPADKSLLLDASQQLDGFLSRLGSAPNSLNFLTASFAFAALFGFGGYLASLAAKKRAILVAVAAISPLIILFLAYWRLTDFGLAWPYTLSALALAFVALVLLDREAKADKGFLIHPGVGATLALAVSGAVLLVLLILFSQMWLSLALSGQAVVSAFLWQRFRLSALQWTAMALAVIASFRLIALGEAFDFPVGSWPIFNSLLIGLGGSAALLAVAAFVFVKTGVKSASATVQSLTSASIVIGVTMLSLQIHHLMSGGDLQADIGFAETGLQISLYALIAFAIRFFLGSDLAFAPKWTERVALFVSAFSLLFFVITIQNPWWGLDPALVFGGMLFNTLILVLLLPAIIMAANAIIWQSHGNAVMAKILALIAGISGFVWLTLEVRRSFSAPDLSDGVISDVEAYAYSASWLIFAIALLSVGFWKNREALRISGLLLLAITSIKVFIFDLAGLDGLLRGLSFLGLGGSLMGIALLYQRLGGKMQKLKQKP
ncbi:MAG: DUF2339 domain-containing protein [Robiginitomaculum sp.]|nr:DUF2339 domain-containing protein [Robiginitomaculum sp.]